MIAGAEPRVSAADMTAAVLLCLTAGIADAVGYLHSGIFAANMTGNTVLVGVSIAQQDWLLAVARVMPIVAFFAGAVLGRFLLRLSGERSALVVEALMIGICALVDPRSAIAVCLIAVAMGIQATAITKFSGVVLSTVVVTSTLARLAEAKHDYLAARLGTDPQQKAVPVALLGASWLAYGLGALVAGLLLDRVPSAALLLAVTLVLVVMGLRWRGVTNRGR